MYLRGADTVLSFRKKFESHIVNFNPLFLYMKIFVLESNCLDTLNCDLDFYLVSFLFFNYNIALIMKSDLFMLMHIFFYPPFYENKRGVS